MPSPKKLSLLLAVVLSLLLIVWIWSGDSLTSQKEAPEATPAIESTTAMKVETRWLDAEPFTPIITLQGQLHPWQQVELRAETSGRVERLVSREGQQVASGAILLQLAEDTRPARLEQLRADRETRGAELKAAERLRGSDLLSETELLRLRSSLLAAEADVKAAELELNYTRPRAPFAGWLEQRQVELGEFVQPGQALFTLLKIDRLKAIARVPQQRIAEIQEGQPVKLELLDGRQLQGQVSLVGNLADPATRTFQLEAAIDNPELLRLAGASATLRIEQPATTAHYLSLALLSLDNQGRPGVKHLNEQQQVVFTPVRLLSSDIQGAWVSGLPLRVQLITLGAGFVAAGDTVIAVEQARQEAR